MIGRELIGLMLMGIELIGNTPQVEYRSLRSQTPVGALAVGTHPEDCLRQAEYKLQRT